MINLKKNKRQDLLLCYNLSWDEYYINLIPEDTQLETNDLIISGFRCKGCQTCDYVNCKWYQEKYQILEEKEAGLE